MIQSIRKSISSNLHTIVFSDSFSCAYVPVVQDLLSGPIQRLSLNTSVASRSACIIQSLNFCTSEEEKLSKVRMYINFIYFSAASAFVNCWEISVQSSKTVF